MKINLCGMEQENRVVKRSIMGKMCVLGEGNETQHFGEDGCAG